MLEDIVRRFLYHPVVLRRDAPVPAHAGDAHEVWARSPAGDDIHGLYWRPPAGRPTVLFLHGNAQSVFEWSLVAEELAPMGCGLLLVDYPGYGKSTGQPSEDGLYAAAEAAMHWLDTQAATPADRVVVFGKSLGGPVATHVAVRFPVLAVVLESTFRSIPHVVDRLLPFLPAGAVLRGERYDSAARIGRIAAPVLVIHGTADELIPVQEGLALHEAVVSPRALFLVEGAGHNDVSMVSEAEYGARLRRWLDGVTATATAP